jgi:hypothetical protein
MASRMPRAAFYAVNFIEDYVKGDAHIVFEFSALADSGKFELMFFVIPAQEQFSRPTHELKTLSACDYRKIREDRLN